MKKLLFILTIIASSTTFCTLMFDQQTNIYYSANAPKNVNQSEYHNLAVIILTYMGQCNFDAIAERARQNFAQSTQSIAERFTGKKSSAFHQALQQGAVGLEINLAAQKQLHNLQLMTNVFTHLKSVGTPAALQLMHDLAELIK